MSDHRVARRAAFDALFRLWTVNLVAGGLLAYRYILAASGLDGALATGYAHFLLIAAISAIYLACYPALALPLWLAPRRAVLIVVAAPVLFGLGVLILLDTSIFRIYRFHINGMVLNLLTTEGAWDSVVPGMGTVRLAAFILGGALLLEIVATRWALAGWDAAARAGDPVLRKRRRTAVLIVAALVAIIATDKVIYAVADLGGVASITRQARLFPLYQAMTIRRFAERWFGFQADHGHAAPLDPAVGTLDYPKQPLKAVLPRRLPNILWIVIDAFRSDMLSSEVAPNISRLARESLNFRNHYSGGNATRFGTFSLFYGLYGSYWRPFLEERRGPVLIDELGRLGYELKVIATTRLSFPEFRETVFVRVPAVIEDRLPGTYARERDQIAAGRLDSWLGERDRARPFFASVFLNAAHGPYSYPDEFRMFTPAIDDPNYVSTTTRDVGALLNAYRNAIRFDDDVTGRMLGSLERHRLVDDTVVLVTADHGEEFLEHGFFGHTSAFSREQARVAFVLRIPGHPPGVVTRLTSHLDVVPTILSMLGYGTPASSYSQGTSLLAPTGADFVVCMGWDQGALIDAEGSVVFSTETYNARFLEVRDADYRLVVDERAVLRRRRASLDRLARGMREFLR